MLLYNMKEPFANERTDGAFRACAICLRNFAPSSTNSARCGACGLAVELACLSAFASKVAPASWNCPPCSRALNHVAECEVCGYSCGFLCSLQMPAPVPNHWIHPFCGCFHREFKKNRGESFFIWDNREHVNKVKKKHKEKQTRRLQSCAYCERAVGYMKQCTGCLKSLVHAICACRGDALITTANPSKLKLTVKQLLCPNCNIPKDTIAGKEETMRKGCAETRALEAPTSECQLKEECADMEMEERAYKKDIMAAASAKAGVLEGVLNFIIEIDALRVLSRSYYKFVINLLPEDIEVLYENKIDCFILFKPKCLPRASR
eukprot:TRINITY_DN11753_c0_g2_i2.p1 TRINITY_DN11753_c0_g2~~TRINITY_DN11753_c0_g2_i2.p1  ORF type:complete len:320 (-),score=40.96 TRINITY_DN11753_c0_g2_i2:485-1444(-)